MKHLNSRDRRKTPHVEIKLHVGSQIAIHRDDERPISIHIERIEPQGMGVYTIEGKDVATDDSIAIVVIR